MNKSLSLAGVGMYVSLVEGLLHALGFVPPAGSVEAAINGGIAIFGLAIWAIGQFKRRDLHLGLVRKY